MNDMDWSTPDYLANIAADELDAAMGRAGISFRHCGPDEDGIGVSFGDLRDAETLLTLAVRGTDEASGIYDRATSGCLSLSLLADAAAHGAPEPSDDVVNGIIDTGWVWMVHPHMNGRRMGWHVTVTMTPEDANAVTAELNRVTGGAA